MLAHVNDQDSYGYTPLLYACKKGNIEMIKLLLENGACPLQPTQFGNVSALHRACLGGHIDAVALLLQYGADKNVVDNDGRSVFDAVRSIGDEKAKLQILEQLH
jgi:ankyrin repeat protein